MSITNIYDSIVKNIKRSKEKKDLHDVIWKVFLKKNEKCPKQCGKDLNIINNPNDFLNCTGRCYNYNQQLCSQPKMRGSPQCDPKNEGEWYQYCKTNCFNNPNWIPFPQPNTF